MHNFSIYLLNCLYADRPVSTLIPLQLKKRLCTTVVLFHCCTLIWGLTNNNYSLYLLWTFYGCQCQYTFVLYLTWGQLLSDVIDYITITLQFSWLHYITITSIFKCNQLNYNYFVNVIDYITDYI
jgi:hypothetical protein